MRNSEIVGILSEYFPQSSMGTGVDCAAELQAAMNLDFANTHVCEVPVVKYPDIAAMNRIADVLVLAAPLKKISCIKDYRWAFPSESLKDAKDAIEEAYRRNGFDNSGRKYNTEEEPLAPWEQELLHGTSLDTTKDDESDRF